MEVSPANRDVRPSAFAKLYYFMRPDRGRMVCSLVLACIGEAVGMVPYVVIALLAAGLIEGTLTFERAALLAAVAALAEETRRPPGGPRSRTSRASSARGARP